jgi:hypothetical protein
MNTRDTLFKVQTHRLWVGTLIGLLVLAVLPYAVLANPMASVAINPTYDAFVDATAGPKNNLGLIARWSPAGGGSPAKPGAYIIMKFDLNAVTGGTSIEQARLNMGALACNSTANVDVSLYVMPDSFDTWTETAMPTFASTETAANSADAHFISTTPINVSGGSDYFHWTDTGSGNLVNQLNLAGNTVTLMLRLNGPGADKVTFADRNNGAATLGGGCPTGFPPVLELATQGSPLAVTMSTFRAADLAVNWPLIGGLGALAAVVIGGLAMSRRRAARG